MGNNEMVGPFGAATVFGVQSPPRGYAQLSLALQRTRLGQLGRNLAGHFRKPSAAPSWQGMQMFMENRVPPESLKRAAVYRNFAGNLNDIVAAGLKSGAQVLLNTVAVNLRDSPPFASVANENLPASDRARFDRLLNQARQAEATDAWSEAVTFLRQAVDLDSTHAAAQYRLAVCLARTGDDASAARHFQLACDLDALPFRADTPINAAIREAAERPSGGGLQLLESAEALAKQGGEMPCGNESFYEHVHFNFDGAYRLGLAWAQAVERQAPPGSFGTPQSEWGSQEECERRLGLTDWNRKLVLESMIRRLQQPPLSSQPNNAARLRQLREREQALLAGMNPESAANAKALYADVIAAHPEDHFLHEAFGNFLQLVGDVPGAIREWQAVGELLPHDFLPWFQIGVMQSRQGHHSEARTNLRRALNIRPGLVEGWLELGRSLGAESKWESASQAFQRACELRPQDPVLWASRAKSAGELGRRAEAIAFYQRAVELRPGYWEARGALGDLFAQAGRIAEAAAQYEAAIKAKPDFAMGHFNLGVMFARQGRLDAAIGEFQTAVRLEPGNQAAAEYLERVQEQRGRKP